MWRLYQIISIYTSVGKRNMIRTYQYDTYLPITNKTKCFEGNDKKNVLIKIHTHFPFPWRNSPNWAETASFLEASRSHSDTPQSAGLLCTSDQSVAETST
jgi:hypothetical protein